MRWLKHLSAARRDEKLADLYAQYGYEGYGFYWALVETVAESMDGSDKCCLTHRLSQWARIMQCHQNKVSKYLSALEVLGLVQVGWKEGDGGSYIRVTVRKLLKYRDEYSKKTGQTQEQDTETDTQTQRDSEKQTQNNLLQMPGAPAKGIVSIQGSMAVNGGIATGGAIPARNPSSAQSPNAARDVWIDATWFRHPKKKNIALGYAALQSVYDKGQSIRAAFEKHHEASCRSREWRKENGRFCPQIHDYINNKQYLGEVYGEDESSDDGYSFEVPEL